MVVRGFRIWSGVHSSGALRELDNLCGLALGDEAADRRQLLTGNPRHVAKHLPRLVLVSGITGGQEVVSEDDKAAHGFRKGEGVNRVHRSLR